jgi:hypothetical protein
MLVLSIILKLPSIISGVTFSNEQAQEILDSNSLVIMIFFLITLIITQKPPFFNIFGQKKTVSFETV